MPHKLQQLIPKYILFFLELEEIQRSYSQDSYQVDQ